MIEIGYEDFSKISLKIGLVVTAETVDGSEKLLKLLVDIGEERPRQVFAGIAKNYQPAALVQQRVVVVTNLAPRKMRFGLSEAMLLVSHDEQTGLQCLIQPNQDALPGTPVR